MINKIIDILEYSVRRGEKLDEVADSLSNAGRDDTENHECDQKSKRPYELESVYISHVNASPYESTEYNEL